LEFIELFGPGLPGVIFWSWRRSFGQPLEFRDDGRSTLLHLDETGVLDKRPKGPRRTRLARNTNRVTPRGCGSEILDLHTRSDRLLWACRRALARRALLERWRARAN